MRSLAMNEIEAVFGGTGSAPACPAGTTMTSVTVASNGSMTTTCTSNATLANDDTNTVSNVLIAAGTAVLACCAVLALL
jgi:hypothetical protein